MSEMVQIQKVNKSTTDTSVPNSSKLLDKNRKPLVSQPPLFQAKLAINQPGDKYEQEADRVAEQVMRMQDPILQRKCAKCDEDEEKVLQAKESPEKIPVTQDQDVPPIVHEVLRSPGQPLDAAPWAFMEPRFGHDFSQVRVYNDTPAAKSAKAVNAQAYTLGNHIVFGQQKYTPESWEGLHLLAHELTHVVQQRHTAAPLSRGRCSQLRLIIVSTLTASVNRICPIRTLWPDFKSLPLNQLIKYRYRVSDYAVIDFIDQLINEHLNAQTLDQLFEYLATEKDQVVAIVHVHQWLAAHAPTSLELAAGKNKPGLTERLR